MSEELNECRKAFSEWINNDKAVSDTLSQLPGGNFREEVVAISMILAWDAAWERRLPAGSVAMPDKLTAENGANGALMTDFRARLSMEFSELTIRRDKLRHFILSDKYDELPEIDRKDLREQLEYMEGYLSVLNRRVSRQCGDS